MTPGGLHHLDLRKMPRGRPKLPIAGQQGRTEEFRQGDIGRIIGREVRPKGPHPRQERGVGMPGHRKGRQQPKCFPAPSGTEHPSARKPAQHLSHLDVDQVGRMPRLATAQQAVGQRVGAGTS